MLTNLALYERLYLTKHWEKEVTHSARCTHYLPTTHIHLITNFIGNFTLATPTITPGKASAGIGFLSP